MKLRAEIAVESEAVGTGRARLPRGRRRGKQGGIGRGRHRDDVRRLSRQLDEGLDPIQVECRVPCGCQNHCSVARGEIADAVEGTPDRCAGPAGEVSRHKAAERHGNNVSALLDSQHYAFEHPGKQSLAAAEKASVEGRVGYSDRLQVVRSSGDAAQYLDVQDLRLRCDANHQPAADLSGRQRRSPGAVPVLVSGQVKWKVARIGNFAIRRTENVGNVERHGLIETQIILDVRVNRIDTGIENGDLGASPEGNIPGSAGGIAQ